jgi:hypothetical protein
VHDPHGIPLPGTGLCVGAELEAEVGSWLRSWAMRDLADVSGWVWPDVASDHELARALAALSADWDFRGRAAEQAGAHSVERSFLPTGDALVVGGQPVDPAGVVAAARALRLVDSQTELEIDPTHVAVLSGTARANVNRARFAADVLGKVGARPAVLVGLTAHRELGGPERASCAELGLAATDTEWTTLRDALTEAFALEAPSLVEESGPDGGSRGDRFRRSARYRWTGGTMPVELVVVPSPSAGTDQPRPANTADQLTWWGQGPDGPNDDASVLLVTTQIYVPYQQLVAARILQRTAPGCRILTIGVSKATGTVATREFTAQDYLQEVRSALLAAVGLLDDLAASRSA